MSEHPTVSPEMLAFQSRCHSLVTRYIDTCLAKGASLEELCVCLIAQPPAIASMAFLASDPLPENCDEFSAKVRSSLAELARAPGSVSVLYIVGDEWCYGSAFETGASSGVLDSNAGPEASPEMVAFQAHTFALVTELAREHVLAHGRDPREYMAIADGPHDYVKVVKIDPYLQSVRDLAGTQFPEEMEQVMQALPRDSGHILVLYLLDDEEGGPGWALGRVHLTESAASSPGGSA